MSNLVEELKLKPFNYDKARAGFPVVCVYSCSYVYKVRQLMFCEERGSQICIAADIDKSGIIGFSDNGLSANGVYKLWMEPVTKTIYRNSYLTEGHVNGLIAFHHDFPSKEAATAHGKSSEIHGAGKLVHLATEVEVEE